MAARRTIGCLAAVALASAIAGCQSVSAPTPTALGQDDCGPSARCAVPTAAPPGLVVENRTGDAVVVTTRTGTLRVDANVIDGTLDVPIPEAALGSPNSRQLGAGQNTTLDAMVVVPNRMSTSQSFGGVIALPGSPPMLAVGQGKVFVRTSSDGVPFFDAEDPKATTLVRVDATIAECAPGTLDAPFDDIPESFLDGQHFDDHPHVYSVRRDEKGCRVFDITSHDDAKTLGTMRACIPDAAYPFADDAEISVNGGLQGLGVSTFLNTTDGTMLELTRAGFNQRVLNVFPQVPLALDHDPRCAVIDATCGHVDLPARITARTNDGSVRPVIFGERLPGSADGDAVFVLGAASHPVHNATCRADDRTPQADAWLVRVHRP